MSYKYSTQIKENCSKAIGNALPISRKQSIMICQLIRKKNVQKAKKLLEEAITMKKAVPFTRFNRDMGHKSGIASGRYCVKACTHILDLLKSAEANAQFKGLSTANLIIMHASAQKGPKTWHYGRHRGIKAKRTHIELVLEETKAKEKKPRAKKAVKKVEKKQEIKKETSKPAEKTKPKEENK